MNGGLAWANHLAGAVLATNSEVATLPLANIREVLGSAIWRTDMASGVEVTADLGAALTCRVLAVAAANFSSEAEWRLRLSSSDAHAGDLYDSGMVPIGVALIAGERGQGAHVMPAPVAARYARIDFADTGRAGLGFFDVGHLWLSDLWQPVHNFSYGAQGGLVDPSDVVTSLGGQDYTDRRPSFRVERFSYRFLEEAEVLDDLAGLDALAGTRGNVLFMPHPGGVRQNRKMLIGRQTELGSGEMTAHGIFARSFEIKERL